MTCPAAAAAVVGSGTGWPQRRRKRSHATAERVLQLETEAHRLTRPPPVIPRRFDADRVSEGASRLVRGRGIRGQAGDVGKWMTPCGGGGSASRRSSGWHQRLRTRFSREVGWRPGRGPGGADRSRRGHSGRARGLAQGAARRPDGLGLGLDRHRPRVYPRGRHAAAAGWISVRFGTLAARASLPPYGSMTCGTAPPRCCLPRASR
jgi:hypothetical protein